MTGRPPVAGDRGSVASAGDHCHQPRRAHRPRPRRRRRPLGLPGRCARRAVAGHRRPRPAPEPAGRHQRRRAAHRRADGDRPPRARRAGHPVARRAAGRDQEERDAAAVAAGADGPRPLRLRDPGRLRLPAARADGHRPAGQDPGAVDRLGPAPPQRRGRPGRGLGGDGDVGPHRLGHDVRRGDVGVRRPARPAAGAPPVLRRDPARRRAPDGVLGDPGAVPVGQGGRARVGGRLVRRRRHPPSGAARPCPRARRRPGRDHRHRQPEGGRPRPGAGPDRGRPRRRRGHPAGGRDGRPAAPRPADAHVGQRPRRRRRGRPPPQPAPGRARASAVPGHAVRRDRAPHRRRARRHRHGGLPDQPRPAAAPRSTRTCRWSTGCWAATARCRASCCPTCSSTRTSSPRPRPWAERDAEQWMAANPDLWRTGPRDDL